MIRRQPIPARHARFPRMIADDTEAMTLLVPGAVAGDLAVADMGDAPQHASRLQGVGCWRAIAQ